MFMFGRLILALLTYLNKKKLAAPSQRLRTYFCRLDLKPTALRAAIAEGVVFAAQLL